MAAVARSTEVHPVTPVGYEVNDKCELSEAVEAGDLLKFTGAMSAGLPVMSRVAAGGADADGIALTKGKAGKRGFSYGVDGEMDGFTGLTPGGRLYPSGSVAGGLDTTVVAAFTPRVKAISTTRIRFRF